MKDDNPPAALLTFLDLASHNIKSALQKPSRSKRRSNTYHRKYLSRKRDALEHAPDELTFRSNAVRHRQLMTSSSTNDLQRRLEQKTMEDLFEVSLSEVPPIRNNKPPLRMRNLPASFFLEPYDSGIVSEDSSTSVESHTDPLKDLIGPDSPMEELLSSPSWKAIVASNTDFFSYPSTTAEVPQEVPVLDACTTSDGASCSSPTRDLRYNLQEEGSSQNRVLCRSGPPSFRSCCRFQNEGFRNGQLNSEVHPANFSSGDQSSGILADYSLSCTEAGLGPETLAGGWGNYAGGWATEDVLSSGRCFGGRMACTRDGALANRSDTSMEEYYAQNSGVVFGERGIWCQ